MNLSLIPAMVAQVSFVMVSFRLPGHNLYVLKYSK